MSAVRKVILALLAAALPLGAHAATVVDVTTSQQNGQYALGSTIALEIVFSEPVDVTGKPQILLETGAVDRFAVYSTATGTDTLIFNYVVQSNDASDDLALAGAAIDLNGGSIANVSDMNAADVTLPAAGAAGSLSDNKQIAVDGTGGANQAGDLDTWEQYGDLAANWVVAPDKQSVEQTLNADPAFLVTPITLSDAVFEGRFRTTAGGDDDWMGITFGWQEQAFSPPSATLPTDFYVLDWRRVSQTELSYSAPEFGGTGNAPAGVRILKIEDPGGGDDPYSLASMWTGIGDGVTTLLQNADGGTAGALGGGWVPSEFYRFKLTYNTPDATTTNIQVEIFRESDNAVMYDVSYSDTTNPFGPGRVGFYNYSQAQVEYSGLTFAIQPPPMTPTIARQSQRLDVVFADSDLSFDATTTVDFVGAGITVENVTVLEPTILVATIVVDADAALGNWPVTLTTQGTPTAIEQQFTVNGAVNNALTVSGITPDSVLPGGIYPVTLNGDNFANDLSFSPNAGGKILVTPGSLSVNSDDEATLQIDVDPTTSAGSRTASVLSSFTNSSSAQYVVAGLDGLTQSTTLAGASGTATLTGQGFYVGLDVDVGPLVTTSNVNVTSATELTFDYLIANVAVCSRPLVSITDSFGGSATLTTVEFVIDESDAGPPDLPGSDCVGSRNGDSAYVYCKDSATSLTTWADAQTRCQAWGGHLMQVDDADEQTFLESQDQVVIWIGANDIAVEDTFVWTDGSPIDPAVSNWCDDPPFPSGNTSDCVVANVGSSTRCWDAQSCTGPRRYICEKDASTIPMDEVLPSVTPNMVPEGSTVDVVFSGWLPICTGSGATLSGTGITINSCDVDDPNTLRCSVTVATGIQNGFRDATITSTDIGDTMDITDALGIFRVNSNFSGTIEQGETKSFNIFGAGFLDGATLDIESDAVNIDSFAVLGPSQISFTATAPTDAFVGDFDVSVTNGGGLPAVVTDALTVTPLAGGSSDPTLTNVSPDNSSPGTTGLAVTVTGTNFTPGATVDFGAGVTNVNCTPASATTIDCTVDIDAGATLGLRDVTVVTNVGPTGTVTLTDAFNIISFGITGVVPSTLESGQSLSSVQIQGFGFQGPGGPPSFDFGAGVTLSNLSVFDDSTVIVTLTVDLDAAPGNRDVSGSISSFNDTLSNGFTVTLAEPTISGVTPDLVQTAGAAVALTINGANFRTSSNVTVTGGSVVPAGATYFTAVDELVATFTPPTTPSVVDVTATNASGDDTSVGAVSAYGVLAAAPTAVEQGAVGQLTLSGVSMNITDTVAFGTGITVNSIQNSGSDILVNYTVDANATLGATSVTVTDTATGFNHTAAGLVTITPALPTILAILPSFVVRGSSFNPLGIGGTAFANLQSVAFSAGSGLGFMENTPGIIDGLYDAPATPQKVDVTVTTSAGSVTSDDGLTIWGISSVTAVSVAQGESGQLTISGEFDANPTVDLGAGVTIDSTTVSAGQDSITVDFTVDAAAAPGARTTSVSANPEGFPLADSSNDGLTVVLPQPVINTINPERVGRATTSQTLTIIGENFGTTPSVRVDGASTTVDSSDGSEIEITFDAPTTAGLVDVEVTGPTGVVTETDGLAIWGISGVTPVSAPRGSSGVLLTIQGAGFAGDEAIDLGTGVTGTVAVQGQDLVATLDIAVDAPLGLRDTDLAVSAESLTDTFNGGLTVTAGQPTITDISPSVFVRDGGGGTATVTGTNFVAPLTVLIDGVPTAVTPTDETSIDITVPNSTTAMTSSVEVQATGGNVTASGGLLYWGINTVTPVNAQRGESSTLTIEGVGLDTADIIDLGADITVDLVTVGATGLDVDFTVDAAATLGARGTAIPDSVMGTLTDSNAAGVTVIAAAPTITSLTPESVNKDAIVTLTIQGTNFGQALSVNPSSGTVTGFNAPTDSELHVDFTAPGTAGDVTISVAAQSGGPSADGTVGIFGIDAVTPQSVEQGDSSAPTGSVLGYHLGGSVLYSVVNQADGSITPVFEAPLTFQGDGTSTTFPVTFAVDAPLGAYDLIVESDDGAVIDTLPGAFTVIAFDACNDGPPVICNDPPAGPCWAATGSCDPATGECVYTPLAMGAACDDGVDCTVGGTCDGSGQCGVIDHEFCNDTIACTSDFCDPINDCVITPNGAECDPNFCPSGGDVNGNNTVDVADAVCVLLSTLAGPGNPPDCIAGPFLNTDMNCDMQTNVQDVLLVIQIGLTNGLSPVLDRNVNVCVDACEVPACDDGAMVCDAEEDCLLCPEDCGGCMGACDTAHATPGCMDADIQECVCSAFPACCSELGEWTTECATYAVTPCGL